MGSTRRMCRVESSRAKWNLSLYLDDATVEYVSVRVCSFSDISCISGAVSLSELALDGNPMSHELSYKQTVLRHVTQIRQLDMKRVTVRVVCSLCIQIYANVCKQSDLVFGPNSTWLVTSGQDTTRRV